MFKSKSGTKKPKTPRTLSPLRAIRLNCLDCCNGSSSVVKYCTNDGVNSTRCPVWPFRFGKRPKTAAQKYGDWLLDPRQMPSAAVTQEEAEKQGCPAGQEEGLSQKKCAGAHTEIATGYATGQGERP